METKSIVSGHRPHRKYEPLHVFFNKSSKVTTHVQYCQLSCGIVCYWICTLESTLELLKYHLPAPVHLPC